MYIVFKVNVEFPSTPAIVGDTNFQKHYTGVNRNVAWDELTPAIRQATEKFVLPYVGAEFYDAIAALFIADAAMDDAQKKSLELLQDAIAYYSIYHVLPEKNTVVASMGIVQNSPEGGSQPTNQWSWKAARWSALENGDTFLDRLLNYLESRVIANDSYFNLWKNSSAYKVRTSDFFRHTSELDEYLNLQGSRRSFISLVRWMRNIEEDVIKPVLCSAQYEALLVTNPNDAQKKLIKNVRDVVANLGFVEGAAHHRLVIDGDGFRVVSQTDNFDDRRNQTNNVHENAIIALIDRCERRGRKALENLKLFLEENAATYPLWANSTCRDVPTSKGHSIKVPKDGIGGIGIF